MKRVSAGKPIELLDSQGHDQLAIYRGWIKQLLVRAEKRIGETKLYNQLRAEFGPTDLSEYLSPDRLVKIAEFIQKLGNSRRKKRTAHKGNDRQNASGRTRSTSNTAPAKAGQ